jgi:magnesium chelatase subunit ChlD-like protein
VPTLAAKGARALDTSHLRFLPERSSERILHCFVLDCSGSMLAGRRLAQAKGLLVALFERIGHARDEAALVCFGGNRADTRFGPAIPRWWNERWLLPVGAGGGTPLLQGTRHARTLLARAARRQPAQQRWLWVLTDGRSATLPEKPPEADRTIVIDFEHGPVRLGRCEKLAQAWDGICLTPDDLLR